MSDIIDSRVKLSTTRAAGESSTPINGHADGRKLRWELVNREWSVLQTFLDPWGSVTDDIEIRYWPWPGWD